ncbi:hypothetical protein OPV22_022852 [Ensete ventricosum]|uniref:Chlorophyll a-b binding protein, chloroplastic n=1 Tax=Ensete ventricosum TaxID=4639 RepID=A0AAV8QTF7_ENSVE|nr:hypothetical protein OPV22_022852 [Ensete ventricosum]
MASLPAATAPAFPPSRSQLLFPRPTRSSPSGNGPDRRIFLPEGLLARSKIPEYLTGEVPGDKKPEDFVKYQAYELVHARWAMLAAAGFIIPEAFTKFGEMSLQSSLRSCSSEVQTTSDRSVAGATVTAESPVSPRPTREPSLPLTCRGLRRRLSPVAAWHHSRQIRALSDFGR